MFKGELCGLDWHPSRGCEQHGHRPGLIVQTDNAEHDYPLTIVVAVSTKGLKIPTHVQILPSHKNGLSQVSYARCEQIMTIDKIRLEDKIGVLSTEEMYKVDSALRKVFGMF